MSCLLFNLLTRDVAEEVNKLVGGVYIGRICLSGIFYADDICIIATSKEEFDIRVQLVERLGASYDMKINMTKSKLIVYDGGLEVMMDPDRLPSELDMEEVDFYKYLGTIFFKRDMKRVQD